MATSGSIRTACLLAVSVLILSVGCGANPGVGEACRTPTADVGTVDGWIGYLDAHRDDVALVVDDGRGTRVEHRADAVQPMASASKALNLVAYARAVAAGTVSPTEPVRVGDWERWSVTGSESSHVKALDYLRIPRNGTRAQDPDEVITLDQLVNQMIIWSDNAAPDFLRARLGDQALADAARAVGWENPELPSTTGFTASFFTPELLPATGDRAARRDAEWSIARRYVSDPVFRADVDTRPVQIGRAS